MDYGDFYSDRKFCPGCNDYVPYLMSLEHSYCVVCGETVKLFSEQDWDSFRDEIKQRPKGGRPRKNRDKESA